MHISCKCLNVAIFSRGSIIDDYDFENTASVDHQFFKENISCMELDRVHKEQPLLVITERVGEWVVHLCLNCGIYTHALNTCNTALVVVNKVMITNSQEIASLKSSTIYSPVFKILIEPQGEDQNVLVPGMRATSGPGATLQRQLSEWLQLESARTEERIRQYTEKQYAALDTLHKRAQKDHHALTRILAETKSLQKGLPAVTSTAFPSAYELTQPDTNRSHQPSSKCRNVPRKPSVDAEGLFDLDGMGDTVDTLPSDEELSDTDESGSHDEGIHIPRRVSSGMYAKSLPVNVPTAMSHLGSDDSLNNDDPRDPVDIAASIKALAKSVHGDGVFWDLPRPRFSSQI